MKEIDTINKDDLMSESNENNQSESLINIQLKSKTNKVNKTN